MTLIQLFLILKNGGIQYQKITGQKKDQPFYHLLAENDTSYYVAYVSEQNLLLDDSGDPIDHPEVTELFENLSEGKYTLSDRLH